MSPPLSQRTLLPNLGVARYRQIADALEHEIRNGYDVGQRLPGEHELAERFGVNRHTVRHAIDMLIDAGLVARRHGAGTYVAGKPLAYAVGSGSRFTESLAKGGHSTESVLIRKQVIEARGGVAQRLKLIDGATVFAIETLRSVDGGPFCVISHFLPASLGEAVFDAYKGGSLHALIARKTGIRPERVKSLVTTVPVEPEDAALLAIAPTQWVLRVKSVNVDAATRKPIEYAVTRFRADRVELAVDIA
ncbi:MAG: phosphonate metabolism transcriptional regulator PhnF [Hyphomicrobium sp.]|nr:phosphonate metabolism transcriptional regulator PhnF [Hyphomicrobium sp.]